MVFMRSRRNNAGSKHLSEAASMQQQRDADPEKPGFASGSATPDSDNLSLEAKNEKECELHPDQVTANATLGQQKAEAAALVWSKPVLYSTYAWIWVCFFALSIQELCLYYASVYAYSSFETAPALSTAVILAGIVGAVLKLPIAKTLVLWGRAEGFLVAFLIYMLGMIIIASCNGPSSYAAGYVLYWIGYDQIYVILDIFVADASGLRNRAFAFAFVSTPFIITTFTGSLAAQAFFDHSTWRWAIGAFCIIQPFVFLPLVAVFKWHQKKAEKQGLFIRNKSGRTAIQSIIHYFHEFDLIGALILMSAFILFLLPFSLVSYVRIKSYDSAAFIACVVIGLLLFPVFYLWERYGTRTHFMDWQQFRNPTTLGACILAATLYFSFYCWDSYYYDFLLVTYNLDTKYAGYMDNIYDVGSVFFGVVFGLWIRYSKHFKYECLFFALPLLILASGLMIHFRGQTESSLGYLIMCQIFYSCAGGFLVIGEQMAIMASADRAGVPMGLSVLSLSSSIGGAIGSAVIVAIYADKFPKALIEKGLSATDAETLYLAGYLTQKTYAVGTLERDAANYAWSQVQYYGCIAACAVLVVAIPAIGIWKNYNVNKRQNKGLVI
ncbi:Siderophore iron transporter mirB [Lachnellula suecica]|uniref:Siderophore iron transporter mirB n=1 Tax=Lachnellula suecica TaxID=602035 RepID=A0A8T9C478_9HELO|nr:Siderophore iron transporter mirB [Lachnellula suecica]